MSVYAYERKKAIKKRSFEADPSAAKDFIARRNLAQGRMERNRIELRKEWKSA